MTVGETLKYLRTKRNESQQHVADNLQITRQALTNYENDRREPDIKTLVKLADYYMVSIDMLVGRIQFQDISKAV